MQRGLVGTVSWSCLAIVSGQLFPKQVMCELNPRSDSNQPLRVAVNNALPCALAAKRFECAVTVAGACYRNADLQARNYELS